VDRLEPGMRTGRGLSPALRTAGWATATSYLAWAFGYTLLALLAVLVAVGAIVVETKP
jgi:hypothetical protein